MSIKNDEPAFGEADLSNCDRELIQFPGSIQPHGALLVLGTTSPVVLQASANTGEVLGIKAEDLLGRTIADLGGDLSFQVRRRIVEGVGPTPMPFYSCTQLDSTKRGFDTLIHRNSNDAVILELVPIDPENFDLLTKELPGRLATAVARLGSATTLDDLAATAVSIFRELAGYDRAMFYRFDPDGHGEVIAEAKQPYLEPYLGLHYPESDIPKRARDLYLSNRVRVLADVNYEPVPLTPRMFPPSGDELDMSMSWLRSMSPLHLQYLRNMGVTATLVASLVRDEGLWGLVACHHYSPKQVPYAVRAACDLIAEIVSTRISVLENFKQVRIDALLRRLEDRLMDATITRGGWQYAMMEDAREVLRAVGATGVFLAYEDEILTAGDVPATADLRSLIDWISKQPKDNGVFASSTVACELKEFEGIVGTAAGVLAVDLSKPCCEYLVWLRGEQVHEVRWAGNPHKAALPGNDPRELSPRRSFAVWTESVRLKARPWVHGEIATAKAVGDTLRDVILQVRSMSYLITEDRLARLRLALQASDDGVLIADGSGRIRYTNEAFSRLFRRPHVHLADLDDLPPHFRDPTTARAMIRSVLDTQQSWRGELLLDAGGGAALPLAIRADVVPRLDGFGALGHIVLVTNMRERQEADAARDRVQRAILNAQWPMERSDIEAAETKESRALIAAVLASASLSVMEVADEGAGPAVVPILDSLEASAKRASDLALRVIGYLARD
jgi:light-regulated signal transduction histidine kinase (bacteriophytochrome)